MELSFATKDSAEASILAQELEFELRRRGLPANSLSLRQASRENMDAGSVLSIDFQAAYQVLNVVASLASVSQGIYLLIEKYRVPIVLTAGKSTVELPISDINPERIQATLAKNLTDEKS